MAAATRRPPPLFRPKLASVVADGYSWETFWADAASGVIVGLVALPLAIAFAIASGVPPESGLVTAVVAGFLISALGGSKVQIGGPTGAFIVVVYSIVQRHGVDGLAAATLLAGFMLVGMGLARLGSAIKYIPYPVTVGFTSGIALIIAASQGRDFLGLTMQSVPADFIHKLGAYASHAGTVNPWALGLGLACLLLLALWPRLTRRVPAPFVVIVAATAAVALLDIPVDTIGSRFPPIPAGLPVPRLPNISLATLREVFQPAVTIALLAAIESLLSAVVADGMTGGRHRSDTELIAQGVANIAVPLFGGIPATGAIARTATNVKSGGKTPVAGLIHAATLLLIMLFFGSRASLIPMPALAAILLFVAYNMSEWRLFVRLLRAPKSDVAVLVATFLLTVLIDLTVAIETGMVMAAFLFMRRMAAATKTAFVTGAAPEDEDPDDPMAVSRKSIPKGVEVFEIDGPFFFGAADQFKDALRAVAAAPKVLILRMRRVPVIDATGIAALDDVFRKSQRDGTRLILSGLHARPRAVMRQMGLLERIGEENLVSDLDKALDRARAVLGGQG
ncbi:MAG: sulfate permease [Elusimicrobia bacterium]|nr:sulfate permease [Elusimicrobiota bacterium]